MQNYKKIDPRPAANLFVVNKTIYDVFMVILNGKQYQTFIKYVLEKYAICNIASLAKSFFFSYK